MTDARRGFRFVRGKRTDGTYGRIDVLDLTEHSFRLWVINELAVLGRRCEVGQGLDLLYEQQEPVRKVPVTEEIRRSNVGNDEG